VDARDEDRSFVAGTARLVAPRLQCVTTGADRDNATAILERTWLVHRKELQVTFHVPNPLNQDRRVVESRPVGATTPRPPQNRSQDQRQPTTSLPHIRVPY